MKKQILVLTGAYSDWIWSAIRETFKNNWWDIIALYDKTNKEELSTMKKDTYSTKINVNLNDKEDISKMLKQIPSKIDAFVHAEMFFEMEWVFDQTIWDKTFQVNVVSVAQIVEWLKSNLSCKWSILIISSTEASTWSFWSSAYSSSRSAINNLVKSWANKFGVYNIRSNAIAAGWIWWVMDTDEVFNLSCWITPLGRLWSPYEVANTVKFLCSEDASFVNWSILTVDWWYTWVDSVSKYEYQRHLAENDFMLFTSEFITGRANEGNEIWALSLLLDWEWETEESIIFKRDQLRAADRWAKINRIFVVPPELEDSFNESDHIVKFHKSHPNIKWYRISLDKLKEIYPELITNLQNWWTAFDNSILILDNEDVRNESDRWTLVTSWLEISVFREYFNKVLKLTDIL